MRRRAIAVLVAVILLSTPELKLGPTAFQGFAAFQQTPAPGFTDTFQPTPEHRAIQYTARATTDAITRLNQRISNNQVRLRFEPDSGYLRPLLAALNVPIESQVAVFSRTSLQEERIRPDNPRVIFFNDSTIVAWPRGGFIEAAAIDPEQGAIFYTLQQSELGIPGLVRSSICLSCHVSSATLGVPGLAVASVVPEADGLVSSAPFTLTDHRTPLAERFGGWYVTGDRVPMAHLGNLVATDPSNPTLRATSASIELHSLSTKFDTRGYPSTHSDIVALMVLDHQVRMTNLLTRFAWEVRVALARDPAGDAALRRDVADWAREFVDYLLFIDEAVLPGPIKGASGFAETFTSTGPRDRQGRSLRDLDLQQRLLKYPCSYLIYSEQFDHLPAIAREAIYTRMGAILLGEEKGPRYTRLSADDRRAIVEILRDTKNTMGF